MSTMRFSSQLDKGNYRWGAVRLMALVLDTNHSQGRNILILKEKKRSA
jgi:hypothetical protein